MVGCWLVSLRLILSPRKVQALTDSYQEFFAERFELNDDFHL